MEQTVWFYVGVIATLICLASIAYLFLVNTEEKKRVELDNAMVKFETKGKFICNSDIETKIGEKITLVSGANIYAQDNNTICYFFNKNQKCVQIMCPVDMNRLDLNSEELQRTYAFHEFDCVFEKTDYGVSIGCKG